MPLCSLENRHLALTVSSSGGTILQLSARRSGGDFPLLRPAMLSDETPAAQSACFPLVPFGNRLKGNAFSFEGKTYCLSPNTADAHYLHGDGWLAEWDCIFQGAESMTLAFEHHSDSYCYRAEQRFLLAGDRLEVTMTVTNLADYALPFGLGWHPFFPLTASTRLQAVASGYWQEEAQCVAGKHHQNLPADLDFCTSQPLPRRWVNNGFSGWNGSADIVWPDAGQQLRLTTQPACPVYFLFMSDTRFDPGYQHDFFCIEPMTHAANDHHLPGGGSLTVLSPGAHLTQQMSLQCIALCGDEHA
ncbi:aldose 1-epimerase [Rahnella sp. Lac-M11]|jgi:aldose 1-epimerase|uniref:Aldose 1-epimerase n=1 Tax=Rahnella contaminans TaxID=2703882 RepID=A0A6M2B9D3_9GAMM|nr:aldose 1-epimerase [Rahnella contaminans]NGX89243.1 aldose 1-epimerase [Rahnella contaminans]